jgi:putative lipoprotein
MSLRAVAASFALSLACALGLYVAPPPTLASPNDASVTGTAMYRERIALTPAAVFEATLEDVSHGGGRGKVIARVRRSNPGQVPISFEIEYNRRRIDPRHEYVVQASITERGRIRFESTSDYPVLTNHHGSRVRIMMHAVGPARRDEGRPGDTRDRERRTQERRSGGRAIGLTSNRWGLVSLDGRAVTVPAREREPWIELDGRAMKVTGSGGCNRISGGYEGVGSSLRFGRLMSTQMACASLDTERAFFRALERTRQYRIHGRMLDLMDDRGEVLAQLEERNL